MSSTGKHRVGRVGGIDVEKAIGPNGQALERGADDRLRSGEAIEDSAGGWVELVDEEVAVDIRARFAFGPGHDLVIGDIAALAVDIIIRGHIVIFGDPPGNLGVAAMRQFDPSDVKSGLVRV